MKRTRMLPVFVSLFLLCALAVQLVGCVTVRAEDLMADITPRRVEEADDLGGAVPVTDFAVRLLQSVGVGEENVLLSPLSVISALGLLSLGAEGQTRAQMQEALGLSPEQLALYLSMYTANLPESEDYHLRLANSIWFTEGGDLTVKPDFLQAGADYYRADAYRAPFDRRTLRDINHWVKDRTEGMIPKILDSISPEALMYLINTLAFEAEWAEVYEKEQVRDGIFTTEDGREQEVELMYATEGRYLADDAADGFIKYYKDYKYAFVALLPNEGVSVQEYVAGLDGEGLNALLTTPVSTTVKTAIPKFSVEYDAELSEALTAMGMVDAFSAEAADFSGVGTVRDQNLFVGRVVHKTFIEVGEKGTRAGAATVIQMDGASDGPSEPREVYLDRPFVYMLIDMEHRVPFFIGTVMSVES